MKFFLALAFLTVVCAIPRPGQISAARERVEQLASIQDFGQEYSPVEDGKDELLLPELENSNEPNYIEDEDEDDISENISLDDLINILHRIRHAIQKKIHSKLRHYKDSGDDIYVTSERVHEDSINETADETPQANRTRREGPGNNGDHPRNNRPVSNNTKGNDTASDQKPQINITQIIKEIHDKINDIIENVFRPWLGNKTFNPSQQGNKTVVDNGSISNVSRPIAGHSSKPQDRYTKYNTAIAPKLGNSTELEPPKGNALNETKSEQVVGITNDITTDVLQEANNTELPPNGIASNETEGNNTSNYLAEANSNEKVIDGEITTNVPIESSQLSIGSEVPQNVQASDEATSESQVRFVN